MGFFRSVGLALAFLAARPAGDPGRFLHDEVARLSKEVEAARQAKDYATMLDRSRRLAERLPNNPRVLLALARAHALSGQTAEAVQALSHFAAMGVIADIEGDADLVGLHRTAGFHDVVNRIAALKTPIAGGTPAFTLPEKDLLTESVVFDAKTGSFFVSSVHRRKIVRVTADGSPKDFIPEGRDGLLSVLALAVDAERRSLWAATNAVPQMLGYRKQDEGRASLAELDLDSGQLRRTVDLASRGFCGDIVVGPDGAVYVSAPDTGRILVLRPDGKALETFIEPGVFLSPQGLAWSPDRRFLFIADYALGIARVDPRDRTVLWLNAPEDVSLYGTDGLVEAGAWLVGVQNGMEPHRVVGLHLDDARERIVEIRLLDRAHPRFDEPTLAARVGSDLYYVATSQWGKFGDDGSVDREHLQPPLIMKVPLPWLADR